MDDLWLYISILLLCYLWGSYGLPMTENKVKRYVYPGIFAVAVCFAVVAIKHCNDFGVNYRPVYSMR